jgi:transcriptional regulator with XRE-family HTH domain
MVARRRRRLVRRLHHGFTIARISGGRPISAAREPWLERLRAWRAATGLSRSALAEASGVSAESIKAYESGKRRPPREVLLALLDKLSVHAYDRDQILTDAGYASDGQMIGKDRPDPEHSFEEALAEIHAAEWPAVITNEAMDVVAANQIAQRLWGVDLSTEFNAPVERNLLAQMSNPRIAGQMANWEQAVRVLMTVVKGSFGDVAENSETSKYYQACMAQFLAGDPTYVQTGMRLWLEVEAQIYKWRFWYPIQWRHPKLGLLHFRVVANPVNRRERITLNDWIPLDGPTWEGVRALSNGAGR